MKDWPASGVLSAGTSIFALAILLSQSGAVRADEYDTINFDFGSTFVHDSNVFRLSGAADPSALLGTSQRSDQITSTSLGARFGKSYSLQRFELTGSFVDTRYSNFNFLSFTAFNYSGAWRWSLTPRLRGNLTSTRSETLNSFADFRSFIRNVRTDTNQRFDVEYEVDGVLRLLGGVATATAENAQPFIQVGDVRTNSVEGGVRYVFTSGSSISAISRVGKSELFKSSAPNVAALTDNKFEQREHEARLVWLFSGKSSLDARVAYLERKNANFAQRDFSGLVANAVVSWGITGKTQLVASASRDLASFTQASSSYTRSDRFGIGPVWEVAPKLVARARYDTTSRTFLGPVVANPGAERTDRQRTLYFGIDWQPRRWVSVNASLQNDKRASTLTGLDFDSTMLNVGAQLNF